METFYGISHYSALEYPQGTLIETVANEHEFVIRRVNDGNYPDNWSYVYNIFNKNLEPCDIKRNGWVLSRFSSNSAFTPSTIGVNILDTTNMKIWHLKPTSIGNSNFFLGYGRGFGVSALDALLALLLEASNHSSWLEYIRTRSDINIDEKYKQDSPLDLQVKSEIDILKDMLGKANDEIEEFKSKLDILNAENEELKGNLEKLKNHFFYKLFMKRFI